MNAPSDLLIQANQCLRDGDLQRALELFSKLRKDRPNFLPYQQGFELALKRMAGQGILDPQTGTSSLSMEATHPRSLPFDATGGQACFAVITPVLNGARYLRESLMSVLGQCGDFFIDYLIKDAGSTDGTLPIVIEMIDAVRKAKIDLQCLGLRIRLVSESDDGLYDALFRGFSMPFAFANKGDILTYLNADDVFVDHAFAIAAEVFRESGAAWVCGQPCVIDADGKVIVTPKFPLGYARHDIEHGLHDGRTYYFIQQEGTFWRRDLYEQSGGIDRSNRLAGDFDMWCKFARHTELLAVDRPLGRFRTHPAQLSKQMEKYYAEVDLVTPQPRTSSQERNSLVSCFSGGAGPAASELQGAGPVCFLTEDLKVREIAYLRRVWLAW